ncbi:MAG: SDR family oxidoreductase [Coxiellaceae bacterium]|nr:SDR family oxidoreductase [Coxiellaceae bacterium]
MKTALITGTSTGLGLALTKVLLESGYKVTATMRDVTKKDALITATASCGEHLAIRKLDVTQPDTIETCVNEIVATDGHLDVLINNAGLGFAKTTEHASEEEIQNILDINFLGVVRCTKAVLPIMRKQKSGHIINISSVGGLVGQPFNELYCAAKFAVEGYTESLATYIQPYFGINFTLVEPGAIQSEFFNNASKSLDLNPDASNDYSELFQRYVTTLQQRLSTGTSNSSQTPEAVAALVFDCITADNPPLRLRTSDWANQFCQLKTQGDPTGETLRSEITKAFLNLPEDA